MRERRCVRLRRTLHTASVVCAMLLASGCASLSSAQREEVGTIVGQAKSTAVDCQAADHCATPSPLRHLADQAQAESTEVAPRHYALLLDRGEDALLARLDLIRGARTSIDIQTYIFDKDDSARLVLDELLAAANRGVKVRLLIDQMSAIGDLQILSALAGAHENLQVRIYNPTFSRAKPNYLHYAASVLCCFRRFNQRMHTKLMLVDGAVGVTGGRNYQDDYFDWDDEYNFRDRDVLVAGPAAVDMQANYDAFWVARRSVPVEMLTDVGRGLIRDGVPAMPDEVFLRPRRVSALLDELADPGRVSRRLLGGVLPVGPVEFVADLPQKHRRDRAPVAGTAARDLGGLIEDAQSDVLVQTPYLVISKAAQALFLGLRKRPEPPQVTISTNSLAATDNPVVYALSHKYKRRYLREYGFRIFEYKPFPLDAPVDFGDVLGEPPIALPPEPGDGTPAVVAAKDPRRDGPGQSLPSAFRGSSGVQDRPDARGERGTPATRRTARYERDRGSVVQRRVLRTETRPSFLSTRPANRPLPLTREGARMGLHAKSMVIDNAIGVVGTHNFDPRSEDYNTESAVIIRDPVFAQALAASIRRDIAPDNSWVIAPRTKPPVFSGLEYSLGKLSESLPLFDLWPWRYATSYDFTPGPDCPGPVAPRDPQFHACYTAVGDFPEVNVGPKWLYTKMITAFGAGLVPIL